MANELPIFTVSDFLASVNQTLVYAYPLIEIEGEVASFKVNQNKYVFFDLKDASGSVNCFMTVWQLRVPIEDGMKVVVRAIPKLTPWGKFSLTVQTVRLSGEGSLKKGFELLKEKLEKEGLFSPERKRPLPELPTHIGVISSTQAAGYADFVKIVNERWGGLRIEVAHVQVQGEAAPDQMIRALHYFNVQEALPDVVVVIRGGGSADDLAAFNDERLVRELAASRIPTLVGVGHEVDVTLADMVADVRAATPSNAAQLLVPDKRELISRARHLVRRILVQTEQAVDDKIRVVIAQQAKALDIIVQQHRTVEQFYIGLASQLVAYNPEAVLRRGYALVRGDVKVGSEISIERASDTITAEVKNVSVK